VRGSFLKSPGVVFAMAALFGAELGCNKEHGANGDASPRTTTEASGCGRAGQATGDLALTAKDGKGKTRDYELLVPSSYDPSKPLALSFVYHGAGGKAENAKGFGLQDAPGARDASLFVFPQGIEFQNFGVGWDDACGGYDVALFDQMLSSIKSTYCIDPKRVFVAGFSWGCDHATALACCRGDKIRAIAAGSCADEFTDKADYKTYANFPCPSKAPTGIRFTHQANGDTGYPPPLFATTSGLYRSINGCTSTGAQVDGACKSFAGCTSPFIECVYPGIGHALPSGWSTDSWVFFSTFR
jgi:hypothetical protein